MHNFSLQLYTPRCQIKSMLPTVSNLNRPTTFSRRYILWAVMCQHGVIYNPEVHNLQEHYQMRTEPRPYVNVHAENTVKFGRTYRQTD